MSLFDKARGWLPSKLQQAAARTHDDDGELLPAGTLVYRRKADATEVDLTGLAWVGRTVFVQRAPTDRGPSVIFGDRDYLIRAEELVDGDGNAFEPQQGDRILEVIDGYSVTFELLPTAGEPAWRWSDPDRTIVRVHTKEVAREEVE